MRRMYIRVPSLLQRFSGEIDVTAPFLIGALERGYLGFTFLSGGILLQAQLR